MTAIKFLIILACISVMPFFIALFLFGLWLVLDAWNRIFGKEVKE